jgi:hypothetical protein
LTEALLREIVGNVRLVYYFQPAAAAAGVHTYTLRRWLKCGRRELARQARGAEPDPENALHARLVREVDEAQAKYEVLLAQWARGRGAQARLALELAGRLQPECWSPARQEIRELKRTVAALAAEVKTMAGRRQGNDEGVPADRS